MTLATESRLGEAIAGFDRALRDLRNALSPDAVLTHAVFSGTDEWAHLLSYKLAPHFEGEGCLIVAVTGGTNTGKSTVFNLLLGEAVSPMVATAAATRHPLLAANATRAAQCLEGRLVPEFAAQPLEHAASVVEDGAPENALFVAETDRLPPDLVLLDTPDVDSIDQRNWLVADHIRAAGDVLIAVLTAEKYRDDRVVSFFKQAHLSGRVVIPLMNKANPAQSYAVARQQISEFCKDIAIDGPWFVLPHNFTLADDLSQPIPMVDGETDLRDYLEGLDVPAIKRRVYASSVKHFVHEASNFLASVDDTAEALEAVRDEFASRAAAFAKKYDPVPGAQIGGLFHEYVQARRGPIRRAIGASSKAIVKGASSIGRTVTGAIRRRAELEAPTKKATDVEIRKLHEAAIGQITRDLATSCLESRRNLREPAAHLVERMLEGVDVDALIDRVVEDTLKSESISDEFRAHAERMLDTWWHDHAGRRRVLEGLDALLAVAPAAIAAPLSFYAGGVGVAETVVVAGPIVEQFLARVIEYQFGDAMFDFLSPWKVEQQRALEEALVRHVLNPGMHQLTDYCEVLRGETVAELKKCQEQCALALSTS